MSTVIFQLFLVVTMSLTRKGKKKVPDEHVTVLEQWKERGQVNYSHQYIFLADYIVTGLIKVAEKFSNPDLLGSFKGCQVCVATRTYDIETIPATNIAKIMHLQSGNNQLASSAESYISSHFDAEIVQGCKKHSNISSYHSILYCLDNVPPDFKAADFSKLVFQLLVENPTSMFEKLKDQQVKCT